MNAGMITIVSILLSIFGLFIGSGKPIMGTVVVGGGVLMTIAMFGDMIVSPNKVKLEANKKRYKEELENKIAAAMAVGANNDAVLIGDKIHEMGMKPNVNRIEALMYEYLANGDAYYWREYYIDKYGYPQ